MANKLSSRAVKLKRGVAEQALVRELQEEVGITASLQPV
jgi:8-oxo-dGTP pyrophosphatase MutT (NUDIX family)